MGMGVKGLCGLKEKGQGRERQVWALWSQRGLGIEWERRSRVSRAQENLASSDKGLFLMQTSLECFSCGGSWGNELSCVGPAKHPGLAGTSFLPPGLSVHLRLVLKWHRDCGVGSSWRSVGPAGLHTGLGGLR